MTHNLKQRLVGAFVLAAIAVIFLPSFVKENHSFRVDTETRIPPRPDIEPVRFKLADQPQDIEPAPAPDTMFLSADDSQPVVNTLEEAQVDESRIDEAQRSEPTPTPVPSQTAAVDNRDELLPGAWVIQVASFTSNDTAISLRDRLQAEGHKAYVRSATSGGREVSRVFIGPKLDRNDALSVKGEVDRLLKVDSLVVRFQP